MAFFCRNVVTVALNLTILPCLYGSVTMTWYEDRDNDTYGNLSVTVEAEEQPPGFVARAGDCNDDPRQQGTITFPGAKEPCNFSDFNCDGFVRQCKLVPLGLPLAEQKDAFVVSSLEPGHLFITNAGGADNLSDATDIHPELGGPTAWIQSAGNGQPKILSAVGLAPRDFSQSMPRLWLKLSHGAHARELTLTLGNQAFKNFVRFNFRSTQGQRWLTDGDWAGFSMGWNEDSMTQVNLEAGLTLADFRRSITDYQVQVRDDRVVPVGLRLARISAVAESRERFPRGVISFTFDDGLESQYLRARPKLAQYGYAATAYVIVGFLDKPNYLSTRQLRRLKKHGHWEVAFHAFDPVMHLTDYSNFPVELVERDIMAGKQWLWEHGFGFGRNGRSGLAHFSYPKGEFKIDDESGLGRPRAGTTDVLAIARRHFSSARSISERHRESWPPSDTHKLRVVYVTAPETAESVARQVRNGVDAGEWVILVLHNLVEVPVSNDQWEASKFDALVDYVGKDLAGVPVRTIGQVLGGG